MAGTGIPATIVSILQPSGNYEPAGHIQSTSIRSQAITSNYSIQYNDNGTLFIVNAPIQITLNQLNALGQPFICYVRITANTVVTFSHSTQLEPYGLSSFTLVGPISLVITSTSSGLCILDNSSSHISRIRGISNNYYTIGSMIPYSTANINTSLTGGMSTGTLYFYPFMINTYFPSKSRDIYSVTGTVGANINIGIYGSNTDNNKPSGSPISSTTSGSLSANVTGGLITHTSTITHYGGQLLWLAITTNSATPLVLSYIPTVNHATLPAVATIAFGNDSLAPGANQIVGWSQSFTYNTTLPTVGTLTAEKATTIPALALRAF